MLNQLTPELTPTIWSVRSACRLVADSIYDRPITMARSPRSALLAILATLAMFESLTIGLNAQPRPQTSLELTTSIVRQRYCSEAAGDHTLRLDLRLRFKNVGQQHLILYKGSSLAFRQMISSTVEDAASLRYLLDMSLTVAVTGLPEITTRPDPDKNFVVLAPNATFETMARTGNRVFVKETDAEKDSVGTFGTGDYVLQIQVPTFPYAETVGNELRQRWKASGELWMQGVVSGPMTFKVEKDRKFVDCGE